MRLKGNTRRITGLALIGLAWTCGVLGSQRSTEESPIVLSVVISVIMLIVVWGWLRGRQAGHPLSLKLLPTLAASSIAFLFYTHFPNQSRLTFPILIASALGVVWVAIKGLIEVSNDWEADRQAGIRRNFFESEDGL